MLRLELALCTALLMAASFSCAAQPLGHGDASHEGSPEPGIETRYQAIIHKTGDLSTQRSVRLIGLVLAMGMAGLIFRGVRAVRRETLAARQEDLEGWALPDERADHEADEKHELVGSSGVATDESSEVAEDTAPARSPEPTEVENRPTNKPAESARLIYHVGKFRFQADRQVLAGAANSHLQDLCDALRAPDNTRRVIRIASGLPCRYAKSQVAAQLAQMLADQAEARVLVLEGDVDAPALHKVLRIQVPRSHGLSEQLQRMAELDRVDAPTVMQLCENLHVLAESRWSTPAALGLPQFAELLKRQRDLYDFIVIDGPVVDSWPDSDHFGQQIDGVVFVTLAGARLPDTLALLGQHFAHDLLLRIVKTGEPAKT